MHLNTFIVKRAVPAPKIESFERYLFIGPHPDDIEIGAGATIAKLIAAGKTVTFLICTDGRYGLDFAPKGTTPEALIDIRKEESIRAAETLGVRDVRFLGLSDGGQYDPKDLLSGMLRVIGDVQPDIIFAPDPFVSSECHPDHLNTGRAAMNAAFLAPFGEITRLHGAKRAPVRAIALYMTAKPNRYVKTLGYSEKQTEAILCHASQFPKDSDEFRQTKLYLTVRERSFGLRAFRIKAEGFRVLGITAMHCLPEAGE
ncbi:MAG: PIG-L family deacetylase [Lachnospiraceae bacterium]|nr:PIG-L family deacetylase [Lachnospiraceae bacterium]